MQFVKPYKVRASPLLLPLLIKYTIDDIIMPDGLTTEDRVNMLIQVLLIFSFIFVIIRPPVEYFRQYLAQWTSNKILYDIRKKMYGHLQMLSAKFYSNSKVGEIISRVINDVEQTKDFIMTSRSTSSAYGISLAGCAASPDRDPRH